MRGAWKLGKRIPRTWPAMQRWSPLSPPFTAVHAVAERLDRVLGAAGAPVDATYWCPHHPDFDGPCACRKIGPCS